MSKKQNVGISSQTIQAHQPLVFNADDLLFSQRDAYAEKLVELAGEYPQLVVVDADLSTVAKTHIFREKFPERHIQVGIAEQNMMGIAAGLAQQGKIPIVNSLAVFATGRPFDQIRESICYSGLNVKIVGLHAGITLSADGATHQTMEDIALMCSLPGMEVVCPADAQQTRDLLPQIVENLNATYFRLSFPGIPNIISPDSSEFGKIQVLKSGTDITLIATGLMVHKTLQAAEKLGGRGISVEVLNIHTIKPMDEKTLLESLEKTKCGMIVEEHNVYGGLGSIVATIVSKNNPVPLDFVNTGDKFGDTGLPEEILTAYGLQTVNIIEKVIELLKKIR